MRFFEKINVWFSPLELLSFVLFILFLNSNSASAAKAINEVAFDFPADGGVMVMVSRFWTFNRYIQAGFTVGGGVIERDIDIDEIPIAGVEAHAKSIVLPYLGPRVNFYFHVVGVSVGYGVFYAKTDLEATLPTSGHVSGETSGWGTAFYSPLLVLDFYHKKYDLVFGFGLGAFFGSSFPDLEASNDNVRLKTNASPIDNITVHVRTRWRAGRWPWTQSKEDWEDF